MHGRGPFLPGGHPPQQPPYQAPQNISAGFYQQDPNLYFQNFSNAVYHNSFQHNFNVPFQNPTFHVQNPSGFPPPPPQHYNRNFPHQPPPPPRNFPGPQQFIDNVPNRQPPPPPRDLPPLDPDQTDQIPLNQPSTSAQQQQKPQYSRKLGVLSHGSRELLERIERAVEEARSDILEANESVTAWKVSKGALTALQVDSWESLGLRLQEVPPLNRLILTEGKINAFINCFVAVQRIVSVYDLEVAICANEGVDHFEELGLGPLIRHPLVLHYFSVGSDTTEVFKITAEEVITELGKFISKKKKAFTVDGFLDFLAQRRSVKRKETLCLRIQSLGMHIGFLQDAVGSEIATLKKSKMVLEKSQGSSARTSSHKGKKRPLFPSVKQDLDSSARTSSHKGKMRPLVSSLKKDLDSSVGASSRKGIKRPLFSSPKKDLHSSARTASHRGKKRPLFSSLKKNLDKRFVAVHKRVKSFYSKNKEFCGEHIRFVSSSSEDEKSDESASESERTSNDVGSSVLTPQTAGSSDRVSSCPYPSATEEMSRLGFRKKRKLEDGSWVVSVPSKTYNDDEKKRNCPLSEANESEMADTADGEDFSLSDDSIRTFITTWKSTCEEHSVSEVLEKMLQFYRPQHTKTAAKYRKRVKKLFWSSPAIGLLNIAVKSIKCGMWNSIYGTLQVLSQLESTATLSPKYTEYESIDVEPSEKHAPIVSQRGAWKPHDVTLEDIVGKVAQYYELDHGCQTAGKSCLEEKIISFSKLRDCESWLANQFGVEGFKSLGYGEFFKFLGQHASLLPTKLQKLMSGDIGEKSPLEVGMVQHQLIVLASQALNSSQQNGAITKHMISSLISRQFPQFSFTIAENGSMEDFLHAVEKYKNNVVSKCVLFSATLFQMYDIVGSFSHENDRTLESAEVGTSSNHKPIALESVTSKDAVEVLLRAPMLSDLSLWSHWDLVFAPSLGPLVGWLLREVNVKDLLCVVTKDSKVIRIDHAATENSFLEAALRGSSFETAVQLLSLFSVAGGEKHVPLSLLKCHARKAFEVASENVSEDIKVQEKRNLILHGKACDGIANFNASGGSHRNLVKMNSVAPFASRFILDCLSYMPSEFHGFATNVLLSGMQSLIKETPSAILSECNQKERLMLHEIGLTIGIVEWVNDYHAFCSAGTTDIVFTEPSCSEAAASDGSGLRCAQNALDKLSCDRGPINIGSNENEHNGKDPQVSHKIGGAVVSGNGSAKDCMVQIPVNKDAALVVESIRKEEFGLDPNLSFTEGSMLKKQHARLGRALHCLSQELYSEDSHFLLELVQNADDNIYPESSEPTLTFILQESGISILNNELGFSSENIRALCDVGNSTKKGSNSGYIGHKGIGFKSVFRITDAPEIHSNGFHIKFDISDGQIGFVLPTVIPPCDIENYSRLVTTGGDHMDSKCWNTCIVLPFRSKLSEETAIQMFSDLHPSLLLFLHRLQCIMFRNTLNDSFIVMRKEILDDGIVKVSCGKEKMTWLVASQKFKAHITRPEVQATEISIAFTLESKENSYTPHLEQQPVFAFLPLRNYGLKFILQGDFVLTSSREEVDKNNPWNEWLLTKVPVLFVAAERYFCRLSCFSENPGKAIAAYLSFVPLVGEVHGFFSGLPRAIILELRRASCMLVEGDSSKMVPPCNVMRGWDDQAWNILPVALLQEHLGLGFLDKNIVLSDSVAKALGIVEYGPEILTRFMACLCHTENGLKSMGMGWLSSWLSALYTMTTQSLGPTDLIDSLRSIPFIPLADGTFSSVNAGAIWLHKDVSRMHGFEAFPKLYAELRTVDPVLFSASAVDDSQADNITSMLHRIGIQNLSAHEIIKVHILQGISDDRTANWNRELMMDYLCFIMIHIQSGCTSCYHERNQIISELQSKAYILTNHGYKRLAQAPIHFSKEFGNPIDVNRLILGLDMRWHEVDPAYLKHSASQTLPNKVMKWREFLLEIGVTDFVQVVQVDKSVADLSHAVLRSMMANADVIPPGLTAKDWESHELVHLLTLLSGSGNGECCKYLLEVLDKLWDDCFCDKATGYCYLKSSNDAKPFMSSFMSKICEVQWVASSMDDKLHYPKDLFYNCDAVHSVLGTSAPYALPEVRSKKLLSDIGFKTKVSIRDALDILDVWRKSKVPFKASILQMSKFYSFIWDEMATSKNNIIREFSSGPFIFVPCTSGRTGVLVSGAFLSSEEVYWHDPTGSVDIMRKICPPASFTTDFQYPLSKTLCNVYPGLHDFFVNECGVYETPSCRGYLTILNQLSSVALPSEAASAVFQVFLKWTEGQKSGLLSSEDIEHLKTCLVKLEYTILPTVREKWVSLHPSFGPICWCDDERLRNIFEDLNEIDFLYFGSLTNAEQEVLRTKVSSLMQTLGIPALSKVTTREAIYDCQVDCSLKASLVNWAIPYAQRYMYSLHPDEYFQLKQSGLDNLKQLQIVVVEKLFYKYVIKNCASAPKQKHKCDCLLQGNILYTTAESDSHALFLELSRLFFDGTPDLHMANFLHMITTMAEFGSTKEQTELFIVNSQKIPKLPDEESVWLPSSVPPLAANDESVQVDITQMVTDEVIASKLKGKAGISSDWPPADWKTAPAFDYALADLKTQVVVPNPDNPHEAKEFAVSHTNINEDDSKGIAAQSYSTVPIDMDASWTIEEHTATFPSESENIDSCLAHASNGTNLMDTSTDLGDLNIVSDGPASSSSRFSTRDQLYTGMPSGMQSSLTGRMGEGVAFQYFARKFGEAVRWVNQDNETGLPYDIVIGQEENSREYIEVKATRSARKDWFKMSTREWQFAVEKGEAFSVCHVHFGNNVAQVTTFRNPVKQCQQGKLQLVLMMPYKNYW